MLFRAVRDPGKTAWSRPLSLREMYWPLHPEGRTVNHHRA
jgi:hypothetical protein